MTEQETQLQLLRELTETYYKIMMSSMYKDSDTFILKDKTAKIILNKINSLLRKIK